MNVTLVGGPCDGAVCDVGPEIHTIERIHGKPVGAVCSDAIQLVSHTGMYTTTYRRDDDGVFRWSGESKEILTSMFGWALAPDGSIYPRTGP